MLPIGHGLARRRAAAVRLPPLECGHRDPIEHLKGVTIGDPPADRWPRYDVHDLGLTCEHGPRCPRKVAA